MTGAVVALAAWPSGARAQVLPTLPTTTPVNTTAPPPPAPTTTTGPVPTGPVPTVTVAPPPTTQAPPRRGTTTTTTAAGPTTTGPDPTGPPGTQAPTTTAAPLEAEAEPAAVPVNLTTDPPSYPWTPLLVTLGAFGTGLAILLGPVLARRVGRVALAGRTFPPTARGGPAVDDRPGSAAATGTGRRVAAATPPPPPGAVPAARPGRRASGPRARGPRARPPVRPRPAGDDAGPAIPEGRVAPDDPLAAGPGPPPRTRRPPARRPRDR